MSVGLHIMTPTSIVVAGGTASIRPDGGVDFSAATSLSLNGVFTSTYDDYMIVMRHKGTSQTGLRFRVRALGTDASGSNYVAQLLFANGTSVSASRGSATTDGSFGDTSNTIEGGHVNYLYGPNLLQPTAVRSVSIYGASSGSIADYTATHSLSSGYDGITIYPSAGNITGMITVYGYVQ